MIRRTISLTIVGLLFVGVTFPVSVFAAKPDTVEKVRFEVNKRVGKKVVVTMRAGTKMKGSISNVLPDSFDLIDEKTRQPTTIPFKDVEKVRKQGWSTGAKVALGVAIGAGIAAAVVLGALATDPLGSFCPLGC